MSLWSGFVQEIQQDYSHTHEDLWEDEVVWNALLYAPPLAEEDSSDEEADTSFYITG